MHFCVLVLVPPKTEDIKAAVTTLLAPYSETIEHSNCSKWDWWQIGGRWTGLLDGYSPEKDEKNIKVCWLCQGTGIRNDELGKDARLKDPTYNCNGCSGTGKMVEWPTNFAEHPGDIMPVDLLLPIDDKQIPFALLTPDGKWYEREDPWTQDKAVEERCRNEWKQSVVNTLAKHHECLAVVVDIHT